VLVKLRALGPDPRPGDVDEAIGNNSWTRETCDMCDTELTDNSRMVELSCYDHTVLICSMCVEVAARMVGAKI